MGLQVTKLQPLAARIDGATADLLLSDSVLSRRGPRPARGERPSWCSRGDLDDAALVAFSRRLGEPLLKKAGGPDSDKQASEVFTVSLDPSLNELVYMKATFNWHIDGATDLIPSKASLLAERTLPPAGGGGRHQFVNTYMAYDNLTDEEKHRFADVKVVHSVVAAWLLLDPNADEAFIERLRWVPTRIQPLVWTHSTGRKSLVLGATASHIEGMDEQEGAEILTICSCRATKPEMIHSHRWSKGDLIIWTTVARCIGSPPTTRRPTRDASLHPSRRRADRLNRIKERPT